MSADMRKTLNELWSAESVLRRQEDGPVFLTNGCCESTLDDDAGYEVFAKLGLKCGWWAAGAMADRWSPDLDCSFYPLTVAESRLVSEDFAAGPHGGFMLGYSVLYRGRKYLAPNVEICYGEADSSYVYPTQAEAFREAVRLLKHLLDQRALSSAPGGLDADVSDGPDRLTVMLLVPADWAAARFCEFTNVRPFHKYKEWLETLLAGYKQLPVRS